MTTNVSAQLPKDLYEWLKRLEQESRKSQSDIVRAALQYWRASSEPELWRLKQRLEGRLEKLEHDVGDGLHAGKVGWRAAVNARLGKLEQA